MLLSPSKHSIKLRFYQGQNQAQALEYLQVQLSGGSQSSTQRPLECAVQFFFCLDSLAQAVQGIIPERCLCYGKYTGLPSIDFLQQTHFSVFDHFIFISTEDHFIYYSLEMSLFDLQLVCLIQVSGPKGLKQNFRICRPTGDHTCLEERFMLLACHEKSYLICDKLQIFEILCNIYLFSSSCLCPSLAVSVLYFKKIGIGCVNIQNS